MNFDISFSVVIPLFNKAAYIEAALDSVVSQDVAGVEILIVDDGSTDGGADRVEHWMARRHIEAGTIIRLIRQENSGVSAARNTGLLEARGRLIAFLDADDRHCPGFLATMLRLEQAYPAAGLLCAAYWLCWADGRRMPRMRANMRTGQTGTIESFHALWSRGAFTHTNSIVLRRSVILEHGFIFVVGETHGEDQDMWFKMAEVTPVAFVNSALTEYRMEVAGSAMQSARLIEMLPAYLRLEQRLLTGNIPSQLRSGARQLMSVHRINVAVARLDRGDVAGAADLLFAPGASLRAVYWLRTLARCAFMYLRRLGRASAQMSCDLHRKE